MLEHTSSLAEACPKKGPFPELRFQDEIDTCCLDLFRQDCCSITSAVSKRTDSKLNADGVNSRLENPDIGATLTSEIISYGRTFS